MLKKSIFRIPVRVVEGKKPLVNAYNEKCFWVHNGPVLSNLKDLLRAFTCMTAAQFAHHVTRENNDFVNWVSEVLQDSACAKDLAKAGTPAKAASMVERHLKEYHL